LSVVSSQLSVVSSVEGLRFRVEGQGLNILVFCFGVVG